MDKINNHGRHSFVTLLLESQQTMLTLRRASSLTIFVVIIGLGCILEASSFALSKINHQCRTVAGTQQRIMEPFSSHESSKCLFQSAQSAESLSERLKLGDRFDRWKFLQDLLDDFAEDDDVHQVLYAVLERYPLDDSIDIFEDNDKGTAPTATPEQKEIVKQLVDTWKSVGAIQAFTDEHTMSQIEKLIPDPQEDEDGFKSTWDVVIELHGREMVKINEEAGTERWKALSTIARVLIHYDILTEGLRLESP